MQQTHETSNVMAPLPDSFDSGSGQIELDRANGEAEHSHVPTHYPARTGRRTQIIAVAMVLGLAGVFVVRHISNAREAAPLEAEIQRAANQPAAVDVIHVKTGASDELFTLPGEARPFRDSTIYARISGYICKWSLDADNKRCDWNVDIGDHVKEGQVLATIETPELDNQIAAARAKIKQLNAQVAVADTSTVFARLSFKRWAASSGDGAVSVQERDQKESELNSCVAHLEAAKAEVTLAEADLARLLTMDGFKQVTAPFTGTITDRRVDVGDLVSAGSTSNTTSLFSIAQYEQMRVWVDVPQAVASRISRGMTAAVLYGDREFPGHVDRTAETINLASRTLKVEVLVQNPGHELLPGTYLQVRFQFKRAHPPLQIPCSALVWKSSGPQAAVVDEEGKVRFVAVKIARDMGDLVEVEGLAANQRVALNIGSQVPEGGRVSAHVLDSPQASAPAAAVASPVAEAAPRGTQTH
jgi:RND family efflux transporter MFP subunit